jgi:hypothetical protein
VFVSLCVVLLVGCHPFYLTMLVYSRLLSMVLLIGKHLGTLVPVGTSEVRLPLTCFCLGLLVDACAGTLVAVSVLLVCTCTPLVACTMIVYGCTSYWYSLGPCSLASVCISVAWLVLVLPGWALLLGLSK